MSLRQIQKDHVVKAAAEIDQTGVRNTRMNNIYFVQVGSKEYPFKPLMSVAHKYATGQELNSEEFQSNKSNRKYVKETLEFPIISRGDKIPLVIARFNAAFQKYCTACRDTNWLSVHERYKFDFATALFEKVNFDLQTDQQILSFCVAEGKKVNFISLQQRYQDEFISLQDIQIIRELRNGENVSEELIENVTISLPKFSIWLATLLPEKFNTYASNELTSALTYLFDIEDYPKSGFGAFVIAQGLLKTLRNELKKHQAELSEIKSQIFSDSTIREYQWVWFVQDFNLFVLRQILNHQMDIINLGEHSLFKVSHGRENFEEKQVNELLEKKLIVVHGETKAMARASTSQGEEFRSMRVGDYFYLCRASDRIYVIGKITSESQPCELEGYSDGWLQREYEIIKEATSTEPYTAKKKWWTPNFRSTLARISSEELIEANKLLFNKYFNAEIVNRVEKDVNSIKPNNHPMKDYPLNQILYGPPGTGKTYNTVEVAFEIIKGRPRNNYDEAKEFFKNELKKTDAEDRQIDFITFHQSYSYEEFIFGLRPDTDVTSHLSFVNREGIFFRICDRARKNWINSNNPALAEPSFDDVFNVFFAELIEEDKELEVPMKSKGYKFTLTGYDEEKKHFNLRKQSGVTVHNIYIPTLRKLFQGTDEVHLQGMGVYYYPLIAKLKDKAQELKQQTKKEDLKKYVIIIDEINRANISRVFGELITLIEDDKRLGNEHEMEVTLASGGKFSVPKNLYIIGTMNTADKSIALIDIALRRRFQFVKKYPDYTMQGLMYTEFLLELNKQILKEKGADFLLGHSYFMMKKNEEFNLVDVMNNKVIPLLQEYFYNQQSAFLPKLIGEAITVSGISYKVSLDIFNQLTFEKA